MAEVVIAASSGEDAQARGLAEALAALGFKATSGAAVEAEIAKLAEEAKCVVALWSGGAPEREVVLDIQRDGQAQTVHVFSVDRMKTLKRAQGI